jgi:leader peptidase (prepilin peptidase)/N-methyltransferase
MLTAIYIIIYVLIFAIGAVIGSFLNVLIYRIPRGINFVKGFSFCPSCDHRLYPKDLFPIFSWLFLKGRCRYCKEKISPRYLIVEAVTGAAFLGLFLYSGFVRNYIGSIGSVDGNGNEAFGGSFGTALGGGVWQAVLFCAVFCVLLCITLIDADTQEIPDSLNIAIAVLGVAAIWLMPLSGSIGHDLIARAIGIFCVSVPLLIISIIIDGAFGGGDIKLMAAAGLLLGWQHTLVAFFIGIILGGVYAVILLARKKKGRKEHFAFGPCLCVGIMGALLWAEPMLNWYLGMF